MIEKLLDQRVELLDDLKHYIIMEDKDRSSRLQIAIYDLDEIIKLYLWKTDLDTDQDDLLCNQSK